MGDQIGEIALLRERAAEALYRYACPNSTESGWSLYKHNWPMQAKAFYIQADAVMAALFDRNNHL